MTATVAAAPPPSLPGGCQRFAGGLRLLAMISQGADNFAQAGSNAGRLIPARVWAKQPKTTCSPFRLALAGLLLAAGIQAQEFDPPEVTIGELRLFLETRFAQFFFTNGGNVNTNLPAGDPALDFSVTTGLPLTGPFSGQSMNCRACHLVDEQSEIPHLQRLCPPLAGSGSW